MTHLIILVCITTSLGVFWNLTALDNYLELPTLYRNIAIHEFSSLENPAHFTRYWNSPHCILKSNTFYTSYSSPYFVTIGSGGVGCCCSVDADGCAGLKRTVLKTGWICFHVGGSCNLYAYSPTFAAMWKGPYHLSSSFFDGQSWKCVRYRSPMDLQQVHPALSSSATPSVPKSILFLSHLQHPSASPCPPCLTLRPYVPCFTDICFHVTMILSSLAYNFLPGMVGF